MPRVLIIPLLSTVALLGSCGGSGDGGIFGDEEEEEGMEVLYGPAPRESRFAERVFSNEYVRVIRVTLPPGETLPPHDEDARLVLSLSDYLVAYREPLREEIDGENPTDVEDDRVEDYARGECHWHEGGLHAVRNVGETVADFLVFVRTDVGLPSADGGGLGDGGDGEGGAAERVDELAPDFADVWFGNGTARVVRVLLPPDEVLPVHDAPARLLYALESFRVTFLTVDGDAIERTLDAGDFEWHDPERHAVANTSDLPAEFLVIGWEN